MSEISQLQPQPLWQFFDDICSIPHPSKHEEALAKYVIDFCNKKGLDVKRDATGNIIIKKAATQGMENRRGVVLQAHLDMVPQKNENTVHDFLTDPIRPFIDGDWVTAEGTTLGADNGIGAAACLAVLNATDLEHGPLEVLFTIDEETGMTGAFGLTSDSLEGEILLNTDSEQEGEVYMGCAGGANTSLTFDIVRETLPSHFTYKTLQIKGLKGGHSGCDIHTGRANANKLLARFLAGHAKELNLRLTDLRGGTLRNAIPREAFADIAIPAGNVAKLNAYFTHFASLLHAELDAIETNIELSIVDGKANDAFSVKDQTRIIAATNTCPNGVIRMSDDIQGVVETSSNLGVVTTQNDSLTMLCLVRSLVDTGREYVESMLTSLAELSGASIETSGAYPGWKPDPESKIMRVFQHTYEELYGRKPNVMVIHAGLECGLFKNPYPNMDMISFGPTIKFPHSPDEKVEIKSVSLFWEQICAVLKAIPEKA